MIKKGDVLADKWLGMEREDIKWYPTIDQDKCTQCETCVKMCQYGVFEKINNKIQVVKPFNCVIGCTGCDPLCPGGAISHPPMDDLLTLVKNKKFGSNHQ